MEITLPELIICLLSGYILGIIWTQHGYLKIVREYQEICEDLLQGFKDCNDFNKSHIKELDKIINTLKEIK